MRFEDTVAVVTGGASGMGKATAELITSSGGQVAIFDLGTSRGAEVAEQLGARFYPVDVSDPESVAAAFADVAASIGPINVNVNAAGFPGLRRFLRSDGEMFPLELFRKIVSVNLSGLYDVVRHSALAMRGATPNADGERGVIINVASISAAEGKIGHAGYSGSKGGVVAMTLPLARELGPLGIRVVTIMPGSFDTGMMVADPAVQQQLINDHLFPLRLGRPSEFALLVRGIVENPMMNGEVLRLDAGARLT